jgi:hypothetical protein
MVMVDYLFARVLEKGAESETELELPLKSPLGKLLSFVDVEWAQSTHNIERPLGSSKVSVMRSCN